jgi:hypothetical protein
MQLDRARHTYQAARERLLALWPDIDSVTLADTLEGITDLHEMIAAVIRSALVDEALGAGLHGSLRLLGCSGSRILAGLGGKGFQNDVRV